MTLFHTLFAFIAFLLILAFARADLPVHCLPDEAFGTWVFYKGDAGNSATQIRGQCGFHDSLNATSTVKIVLKEPNIAVDAASGDLGTWTNIYDQGFEVKLGGVVYFAFYSYEQQGSKVISHCDKTFVGSYHDEGITPGQPASNWGCYYGVQLQNALGVNTKVVYNIDEQNIYSMSRRVFQNDAAYIEKLNKAQSSWIAGPAPEFEGKSMDEIFRISGSTNKVNKFKKDRIRKYFEKTRKSQQPLVSNNIDIPTNLDWRNVSGVSYVTAVRNQGSCGSCWIFGTVESLQDRNMIVSKRQQEFTLSTQNLADCSHKNPEYGQSCDGGFPYLASKWVHDFGGITHESCYPYVGYNQQCKENVQCSKPKVYVKNYKYVGGYYGAANEANMLEDVVTNGPMIIGIMVYNDFFHYRGGIYHHVSSELDEQHVGRWEEVNHAVELVGYGVQENTGEKYWIIKNSWGESWGLNGYAMIRRGTDEIGIESIVVSAIPYTL